MADEIAKYLSPKDILAARLVSKVWASAFDRSFKKVVPIVLEDSNIKEYLTCKHGLKQESFFLFLSLDNSLDGVEFANKFGSQIRALSIKMECISCNASAVIGFCKILAALEDTLETLTVRLPTGKRPGDGGYDEEEEQGFPFPVFYKMHFFAFFCYFRTPILCNFCWL